MAAGVEFPPTKRRRAAAAALVLAMIAPSLPGGAAGAAPTPQAFGRESLGGGLWSDTVQVSSSPADDFAPQLSFDAAREPNLLWTRAGGGGGDLYYARLTAFGEVDHPATYIRQLVGGYPPMVPPRAPQAALDAQHNIHYVFDSPVREVNYGKSSENGTVLVADQRISASDGFWSILPAVAVQSDDTVHIAHSEYRFRCEDIAYDKLANDGTVTWTNRIVSQDIAGVSEGSLIKADRFNGDLLFTFGTQYGSFAGRYSKFGAVYVPSHQFRLQTDFKVADIAEAPNGSLHIVWEDAGALYYTRFLSNDTKQVDAFPLVNSSAVGAFPRIEAAADGSVAIAWSDNATGTPQVWVGRLGPSDAPASFAPFRVSNSTGGASDAALAVDPGDSRIAIAWADASTGNREIVFKRELGCGVKLWLDPITIGGGDYFHPNKTTTEAVHVRNTGWFRDRIAVSVTVAVLDRLEGWQVAVDPPAGYDLDAGEEALFQLSIATPGNATNGQDLGLTLNATNVGPPPCYDAQTLTGYVRVVRSLDLTTDATSLTGPSGSAVRFNLTAVNTGDRTATFEPMRFGASGSPRLTANFSMENATVAPGERYNFTLDVGIPFAVEGTYVESVRVGIFDATDGYLYDSVNLVVGATPYVELYLRAEASTLYPDPGALIAFQLYVYLGGNLQVQVGLASDNPGRGSFDVSAFWMSPTEERSVNYSWRVPPDAQGGDRFTILVNATSSRLGVVATHELTVIVNGFCSFQISPPSEPTAVGPNATAIPVLVWNRGNVNLSLTPSLAEFPAWWNVSVDYAGPTGPTVRVGRDQTWTTFLIVATPAGVKAGRYAVKLHYETAACGGADTLVNATVPARASWTITANATSALIAPGGSATFEVTLQNLGNLDLDFDLDAQSREPAFAAWLSFVVGVPPIEFGDATVAPVTLPPLATAHFLLRTQARQNASEQASELIVSASVAGLEPAVLRFVVQVGRSNLFPFNAFYVPAEAVEGDNVTVVLKVGNHGTGGSPGGRVRLAVDNEIVDAAPFGALVPDAEVDITLHWTARPGDHRIVVQVQEADGGSESNLTDNVREWQLVVASAPPPPRPPADSRGMAMAALATAGAAAIAVLLIRRQRARRPVRHEAGPSAPPEMETRPPGNP